MTNASSGIIARNGTQEIDTGASLLLGDITCGGGVSVARVKMPCGAAALHSGNPAACDVVIIESNSSKNRADVDTKPRIVED